MRYTLKLLRGINYFLFNDRSLISFSKGGEVDILTTNVFLTSEGFPFASSNEGLMLLES
jgi:hypothetical protein